MNYIKVRWVHSFEDEPIMIFMELDDDRFESRKIEIFKSGFFAYADRFNSFGETRLGEDPIPSLEEIASDKQFQPEAIDKLEFEAIWSITKGLESVNCVE
jgi:hypothetical protein